MHISLEWISQYVDISDLEPEVIADRMTMATAEVEGFERVERSIDGVVAAEIVSVEDIPDAPNLKKVRIHCGATKYTTACGAPNTRVGMKAAFAPAGTTLAGGKTIEKGVVSGCESEGVLCSAMELGLSQFHETLFEIPSSVETGAALSDLMPKSDTIIEIDNKSLTHRPDLWGHYGIAREIAAVFGRELKPLPLEDLSAYNDLPAYPLAIDDLEGCPHYSCMEMASIKPEPSPLAIQWRLHALGQRTFDLLVDLTNYIMFELGQPTHAFDGGKLKAVRVAPMGEDGTFVTLDGAERKLIPNDLMIWNESKPVAVAGVMGGLETEVTPDTTRLLLESANFRGSRIRRTAVRLGLRSEASQRFEKNQPPCNARIAVARFLKLTHGAGQKPEILSRLTWEGDPKEETRNISIPVDYFDKRVGMTIPRERITGILESMGFGATISGGTLQVGIPPFRSEADIAIPPDIVEEVARVYGYDNIEPRMPDVPMKPLEFNRRMQTEHKAQRILAEAHGFTEVHSYSWFDDTWLEAIGYDPGPTLKLANPSAEQTSRMRTTLVPNLLAAAKFNLSHADGFRLFELGRVHIPIGEKDRDEHTCLAGVSCMPPKSGDLELHFRAVKGALEDLAAMIGCGDLVFSPGEDKESPWEKAGAYVEIQCGRKAVGALGYLTGKALDAIGERSQCVWFEIDFDRLAGPIFPEVAYAPASPYPGSWFDVSVVWEMDKGYRELEAKLDKYSNALVTGRSFLGHYKGKGLDEGQASFSFRYFIGSNERTLSGEEIDELQKEFFAFLDSEKLELR